MNRAYFFMVAAVLAMSAQAVADPPGLKTLAIGDAAPDFNLPGVDGKAHALKDYADAKVLVVIFTCNHCPTAQAYEARIARLHADYRDKGVAVVCISPNDPRAVRLDELGYTDVADSFDEMKIRARDQKFAFPYLYDGDTQKTAIAYGVLATPHVYVFDAGRKLRYVGRFDDSEVKTVKVHDTINAVDALLAGTAVPVEKTRVVGCSTKWAEKAKDAARSLERWNAEPVTIEPIDEAGIKALAKNDTKKLTLVNLWATWCGPCLAEMPDFVTTNRMYRGRDFRFVTISTDEPEARDKAPEVLKKNHVAATNYHLNVKDRDKYGDLLDKDFPGPMPYTMLIAPGGKVLYRKTGAVDPLELRKAIVAHLGSTY